MRSRDRIATYLALGACTVALFAVGGALRLTACVAAAASLPAAAIQLKSSRRFSAPPPLLVFLAVAGAFTALQLIPLPAGLVHLLSSNAYEARVATARTLSVAAPSWMPLTLDSPGTLLELAKLAGYCAFALACLRIAGGSAQGRRNLVRGIALAGIAVGVVGVAHYLLGARALFGIYSPRDYVPPILAPLINPNHLAGLMAMTACLCLGATLVERKRNFALAWGAATTFAATLCVAVGSRGGVIALALGLVITAVLFGLQRRTEEPATRKKIATASAVGAGLLIAAALSVMTAVFTTSGVASDLSGTSVSEFDDPDSKFAAWSSSSRLIERYRWTGVGRGAFMPAFTRYHPRSSLRIYSHLENEYLQAAVDWGLPAAAILLLALVWTGGLALRRWRQSALAAGSLGAIAAIAVQNLADFSLEMPGIVFVVIGVLSTLTYVPLTQGTGRARTLSVGRRGLLLVAATAVIITAASPMGASAREDTDALSADRDRMGDEASILRRAHTIMQRHPVDFYAPALIADALYDQKSPLSIRFAGRAMQLHPTHPGTHQLAARIMFAAGKREQALVEYALAIKWSGNPTRLVDEVATRYPDPKELASRLPRSPRRAERLLDYLARVGHTRAAIELARRVLEIAPDHAPTHYRLSQYLLTQNDPAGALVAARRAYELVATATHGVQLARTLVANGNAEDAETLLEGVSQRTTSRGDQIRIRTMMVDVYMSQKRFNDAKSVMTSTLNLLGSDRRQLAKAHRRLAEIERAMGNSHRAEWEQARARDLLKNP